MHLPIYVISNKEPVPMVMWSASPITEQCFCIWHSDCCSLRVHHSLCHLSPLCGEADHMPLEHFSLPPPLLCSLFLVVYYVLCRSLFKFVLFRHGDLTISDNNKLLSNPFQSSVLKLLVRSPHHTTLCHFESIKVVVVFQTPTSLVAFSLCPLLNNS